MTGDTARWVPTLEQARRIRAVAEQLVAVVPRTWRIAEHTRQNTSAYEPYPRVEAFATPPLDAYYQSTIEQLSRVIPDVALRLGIPEFLFFPGEWNDGKPPLTVAGATLQILLYRIASCWFVRHPDDYSLGLLLGRMRHMLQHPFDAGEQAAESGEPDTSAHGQYHEPGVGACLRLLCRLRAVPAARRALIDFALGKWDAPLGAVPPGARHASPRGAAETVYRLFLCDQSEQVHDCLLTLHEDGLLTYEAFRTFIDHFPLALRTRGGVAAGTHAGSPLDAAIAEHVRRFAWEVAENPDAHAPLHRASLFGFSGARFLLKACEHAARLGMTRPVRSSERDMLKLFVLHMAGIQAFDPEDNDESVVAALQRQPAAVLGTLLPYSGVAQPHVLTALGDERAERLRVVLLRLASERYGENVGDIPNSSHPEAGVVDRDEIVAAVQEAGDDRARRLLERYRHLSVPYETTVHTVTLIQACVGWNREAIEASVEKDRQIALKAYGLLPIERGEAEVEERYIAFRNASARAAGYKGRQQRHTRAAIQAGLTNLARNAGFADATRLESAMAPRLGLIRRE